MNNIIAAEFLLFGFLFSCLAWAVQKLIISSQRHNESKRHKAHLIWPVIVFLVILLAASLLIVRSPSTLSGESWYNKSPYVEVGLFLIMLCGMCSSYFMRQIEARRQKIVDKKIAGDNSSTPLDFDFWEFSAPMFVSVITFAAVLQQMNSRDFDFANIILAFQTGFFWQTVLSKRSAA